MQLNTSYVTCGQGGQLGTKPSLTPAEGAVYMNCGVGLMLIGLATLTPVDLTAMSENPVCRKFS